MSRGEGRAKGNLATQATASGETWQQWRAVCPMAGFTLKVCWTFQNVSWYLILVRFKKVIGIMLSKNIAMICCIVIVAIKVYVAGSLSSVH